MVTPDTGVTVQFVLIPTISMYYNFNYLWMDERNLSHKNNELL
jgi:hypothetical protein